VAIISTNYDIAYEFEVFGGQDAARVAREWDFGMHWRDPDGGRTYVRPENPVYRLYKLHGSTNWLRCPRCEHVYVNPQGTIVHQAFRKTLSNTNTCDCGHGPLRAVVVAPSMVRDLRDPMLRQIWTSAYECLRLTKKLVFIGYSLPYEDIAIRSLLLRALHGRDAAGQPLQVVVVQRPPPEDRVKLAKQEETKARYKALFPRCSFRECGAKGYIEILTSSATRKKPAA
jgi:hypothetical protein